MRSSPLWRWCAGRAAPASRMPRSFSLAHDFSRPALECLRRDLLARTLIDDLNRSSPRSTRTSSCCSPTTPAPRTGGGADNRGRALGPSCSRRRSISDASLAALIVPDKGIVLMRAARASRPWTISSSRARTASSSRWRRCAGAVIINRRNARPVSVRGSVSNSVLSAAHARRPARGRARPVPRSGRRPSSRARCALGDILARKARGSIESNYDAMSGLYTRPRSSSACARSCRARSGTRSGARSTSTPTSCTSSTTTSACTSAMP